MASPWSHGFRATELQGYGTLLFFFRRKKSYRVTELQGYRPHLPGVKASELQSYRATGHFYFFFKKKVTELQSYRATGHLSLESWLQSYRATGLRDPFIFFPQKKSYRVTELQGYRPHLPGVMASELQSYRAT